jgi:hypothetical protein
VTSLEYLIKHGGVTPKRLLKKISRRGFGMSVFGSLAGVAASRLVGIPSVAAAEADFTIAIIPDPQFLAESCPSSHGGYYTAMMNWIIKNRNTVFRSGVPPFEANIKAVVGVGDCVNQSTSAQFANAQAAWTILDKNGIAFTTPPGNHDYARGGPSSRSNLGDQFATGYFSAKHRSSIYGSGIHLGGGDMAYWVGSYDTTGANTAVKFVISGINLLVLALDFFAGTAVWSWAHDVMQANSDCECYITTHAWLTAKATQFERTDSYGTNFYAMAGAPYSNSAAEAWNTIGVSTWSNLCGVFCGHDILESLAPDPNGPPTHSWFWQRVPVKSNSPRGQTVQQLYTNSQQLDGNCSMSVSTGSGA